MSNGAGDLIYLLRPAAFSDIDSAVGSQAFDTIATTPFLSIDSLTVNILTDSIIDDVPHYIVSNHRIFTGADGDTTIIPIKMYSYGALNVRLDGIDSNVVIPDGYSDFYGTPTRTIMPDDTVVVSVPQFIDHYYFSHWVCDGDPSIGAITTPSFTKVYSCSTIVRLDVHAVYRLVAKDTIDLTVSGSSWGSVDVDGFADSLGGGVYTVWCQPHESLQLAATANATRVFNAWTATGISSINGSTNPVVRYIPVGNWTGPGYRYPIDGSFGQNPNPAACPPYIIELHVEGYSYNWDDPRVPVQPTSVSTSIGIAITPVGNYDASGTHTSMAPIVNYLIGLTVTNSCYEIKSVRENDNLIAGMDGQDGAAVGASWTKLVSVTGNPCIKKYYITLRHKVFKLTLELEGLDGTIVEWGP